MFFFFHEIEHSIILIIIIKKKLKYYFTKAIALAFCINLTFTLSALADYLPFNSKEFCYGTPSCINYCIDEQSQGKAILLLHVYLEGCIDKAFKKSMLNIAELDFLTKNYVLGDKYPREEKIKYLWSLYIKHQNNSLAFNYIANILSYLKPDEIIKEIIKAYHIDNSLYNKRLLLGILQSAVLSPKVISQDFENAKKFYALELQAQNNPALVEKLIMNYPTYFPTLDGWEKVAAKIKLMYQFPEIQQTLRNTAFWYRWSKALNKSTDIKEWIKEMQYFVKDYSLPLEKKSLIEMDAYTAFVKGINRGVGKQMLPDTGKDGIAYLNEVREKIKAIKEREMRLREERVNYIL